MVPDTFICPQPLREYDLKGHPGACRFWHNQLLIPAGYQGLLLERVTPDVIRGEHREQETDRALLRTLP